MPVPAADRARIAAPRPPEPAPAFQFPVIATVAPLVASLVLFAVTQSPFTLVFAALGPVIAVASFADSRLGARRTAKRERARFARELSEALAEVERRHDAERAVLQEQTPAAARILVRRGADPYRWRAGAGPVRVSLGTGDVPSLVDVDAVGQPSEELDDLRANARMLAGAPVVVDARLGIGIVGFAPLGLAVLRALGVQLAWSLPPQHWSLGWFGLECEAAWLQNLPHQRHRARAGCARIEFSAADDGEGEVFVAWATEATALPASCRIVLETRGALAEVIAHPDPGERRRVRPEPITLAEAIAWSPVLAADAARDGLAATANRLPANVGLGQLLVAPGPPPTADGPAGLPAAFAVGPAGPLTIDLVADGPHAVIGGTTGSGKSELLIAWVLALAAAHPPHRVSFLLVDFKGGSAFAPLEALPHTVGVITDLDERGAVRALESLRAELRFRERALADARVRDIDDVPGMPRLVIVVDEFAAMIADHPDLHGLFGDLAARGRSLGIHLVLCTQRPAGVVRDAVLANADLRLSLRVNNRADSSAVIGTDQAAAIPAAARGRALLALAGEQPIPLQAALATSDDAAEVAARWPAAPHPRRPWLEPLPQLVSVDDLAAEHSDLTSPGAIRFGLLDLPSEQRRAVAVWDPTADGALLVLGAPGSGKSVALATVAAAVPAVWLPRGVPAAWDVVSEVAGQIDAGCGERRVLIVDDLDALVARVQPEHRTEFLDRLARVIREGPQHGLATVLAAQRVAGELQSIAGLVPARLMLRHASRQDWVLAGGDGSAFSDALPPGGGSWLGHRVQVATGANVRPADPAPHRVALDPDRPLAVVTTRAVAVAARLARAGFAVLPLSAVADPVAQFPPGGRTAPTAILGDVDDWQSRWGSIAALRPIAEFVFDGCSPADLRMLTRSRGLPPPIERDEVWRLAANGEFERTVLPG
jgi:S-DNA-T family DNA segregation ATPase FtsK/SpoIIIE